MEQPNEQYLKGFNHGYLISKYMDPLFKKLSSAISMLGDYGIGFAHGGKELELEKEQNILNEFDKLRNQENENDLEID